MMQTNEKDQKYMQTVRNLKLKATEQTQVKFDKSVALPTLLNGSEQDSKRCTAYGSH
jgi:hypothetical protein